MMNAKSIESGPAEEPRRCFEVAPSVRSAQDEHGLVLLEIRSGIYSSFNPVGALVWSEIASGRSQDDVIERVQAAFSDVDCQHVHDDVKAMVGQLLGQGLIVPAASCESEVGVASTTASAASSASCARGEAQDSSFDPSSFDPSFDPKIRAGWGRIFKAWLYLIYIDLSMKRRRYRRVYDIVDQKVPSGRRPGDVAAQSICRAVDVAAGLYVKRAWCLQRSAACVCLLRAQGLPAELVLGVRTFPFEAHAWVELEGRVINDKLDYVGRFLVLDRL